MGFDFEGILNFGFVQWTKNRQMLKYFLFLFVLFLVTSIVSTYASYALFGNLAQSPSSASVTQAITTVVYFVEYVIMLAVLLWLIGSAISYLVIAKALQIAKRKSAKLTFESYAGFLALTIATPLAAIFSVFNLKLLWIPAAAIVLAVLAIICFIFSMGSMGALALLGILFILVAVLLALAYTLIAIYNGFRLLLSQVLFVERGQGVVAALKASWNTTKGNVLNIFIVVVIMAIAFFVLGLIFSLPLTLYTAGAGALAFKQLTDPVAIALSIPSALLQAATSIIQLFMLVGIYSVLGKKKPLARKAIAKRKR